MVVTNLETNTNNQKQIKMSNEITIIDQDNEHTALYLQTKAEIDTQISTAKAFPRVSMKVFIDEVLTLATMTEEIADSCVFSLPRGGKMIEGPSVRLAEIVAHCYGNVRYGARVIENDGKTITSQGICHDLEKNVSYTTEEKKSIMQNEWINGVKTGNMIQMNHDMQVMSGKVCSAIALRNAIFKIVPPAIWLPIYEQVKLVAKGSAETLVDRRNKAVKWFNDNSVTNDQICSVLSIKKIEDIDLDKLSVLSGIRSAIKNGESTVKDIFDPEKPEQKDKKLPKIKDIELQEMLKEYSIEDIQKQYEVTTEQILKFS